MLYIRFSQKSDRKAIADLTMKCFGDGDHSEILRHLKGRYLLAIDGPRLVAMTGLLWNDGYKAYEVDWSCTDPEYRRKGIMHKLFERMISSY